MLLLVLTLSSSAIASDCGEVIKTCDAALVAKNREIQLCRLGLVQSVDRIAGLEVELEKRNSQLQSPLRNPFVMGMVGVLVGIVVTGYALRSSK